MASADQQLERLHAIEAARSALARYAEACDARDLDAVVDLFTDDGELEVPGQVFAGREEIRAFFEQAWRDDPTTKSHFITNVSAGGYRAGRIEVRSYFFYTALGGPNLVLGWGQYDDMVDTSGDHSRFSRKSISIRHTTDGAA